jgi:O-antigen/teichoic acid export membrane protein
MAGYLKRLVSSLGAYQVADAVSKVMAVLLLPVYTRRIAPAGYGIVETLTTFVVFVSIVVRLGIIESFLRYYFVDRDSERRDALARRAVLFLLCTTTVACAILVVPAVPLSRLVTSVRVPGAFRVAVLGVWAFTNLELAQALLRVDERLRAYAIVTVSNVCLTIVASLVLVVGLNMHYMGLLVGSYGASTIVLLGLWWTMRGRLWRRPRPGVAEPLRVLLRFGLPTLPAEASVYALSVLDRQYIVHEHGPGSAGRYAIAIKVAGAIAFIVRAFMYAWPPLAYSVSDDAEAARLYGLVTTYYALVAGLAVAAISLEARYIIRFLAPHPGYFLSYRAVPWVCLGWALYGLWVVLLVIAGRAKVTGRNFPAALAGVVVNVALLAVLVPRYGIAGAGVALCGAYVAMLAVMYLLVRSAFHVSFEWRRLAQLVVVLGGLTVAGELLLPTSGAVGFLARGAVIVAMPLALLVIGFAHPQELAAARELLARARTRGRRTPQSSAP